MHKENYNVHNIIKFQLINDYIPGFLKNINPEYEYFAVDEELDIDFKITISKTFTKNIRRKFLKHIFKKKYAKWDVEILEYENGFVELTIVPNLRGIRRLFEYSALKNLYVRSLLYYFLINKGYTLIHSSAVRIICGDVYVFAGRPGVFKTSLIMDFLRESGNSFLGEENVLLKNGKIYPFPLNLQSLNYKIGHYKNENSPSVLHKLLLGFSLLLKRENKIQISEPCYIKKLFFLEKSTDQHLEIVKETIYNLINQLISNEIEEIEITPTHSFSGINNNFFSEFLGELEIIDSLKLKLKNIFVSNFSDVDIYSVSMPKTYKAEIAKNFLRLRS